MDPPSWLFLTILIVVCLIIAFGILAVVLVALLVDDGTTTTTTETETPVATPIIQNVTTATHTLEPTLPSSLLHSSTLSTTKSTVQSAIHTIEWDRKSGGLTIHYSTQVALVRFVLRTKTDTSQWPIWTSQILTKDANTSSTFSVTIRNRSLNIFQEKNNNKHVLELEDAENYQLLTTRDFPC